MAPIDTLLTAIPLLAVALLRLVPAGGSGPRLEALAVVLVLACTAWNTVVVADWYLAPWGLTASDFGDYCQSAIASWRDAWGDAPPARSRAPAFLPGLLVARFGVIDALWLGATLPGTLALHLGTYLWARALHSRGAGLAAVAAIGFIGPVVVMGRMVTFYPPLVGAAVLATGLGVAALRWPRAALLVPGALVVATLPLLDVRGVLWIPGPLLLLLVGAARGRSIAGIVALILAFQASWYLGRHAYEKRTPGIEAQAWFYVDAAARMAGVTEAISVPQPGGGFVWGRTDVRVLPDTVRALRAISDAAPASVREAPVALDGRRAWVNPVIPVAALASLIAIGGLVRQPWLLGALVVSAAPFVVMVAEAADLVAHPRYLGSGLAVLPPLVGLAAGVLAGADRGAWRELALLAWMLVVSARILPVRPAFLTVRRLGDEAPASFVQAARAGRPSDGCTGRLIEERNQGLTGDSRLLPTPRQ